MIQNSTLLNVIDNSGAKTVACIKVGKGFKRRYAVPGDIIIVSIKTLRTKRRSTLKILKGDVCKALIIRCKNFKISKFGLSLTFFENSVVLLTRQNKFLFTKIFGPIPIFFRYTKYMRVIAMSSGIVS